MKMAHRGPISDAHFLVNKFAILFFLPKEKVRSRSEQNVSLETCKMCILNGGPIER